MSRVIILLSLLLLTVGCSQVLEFVHTSSNVEGIPEPTESLVVNYDQEISLDNITSSGVCVTVNEFIIADSSFSGHVTFEELTLHIMRNTQFLIDSVPVSSWQLQFAQVFGSSAAIPQGQDDFFLIYPLSVCARVYVELGIHEATIVISSLSGQLYSYSWEFTVQE